MWDQRGTFGSQSTVEPARVAVISVIRAFLLTDEFR